MTWIHVNPDSTPSGLHGKKTRRNSTARTTSVDAGGSDACVPRLFGQKSYRSHRGFSWSTWHRTTHRKIFMSFFFQASNASRMVLHNKIIRPSLSFSSYGKWTSRKEWSESGPTPSKLGPISVVIGVGGRRSTEFLWNVKSTLRCFNMFLLVKFFFPVAD